MKEDNIVLIGSRAIARWEPGYLEGRNTLDWDIICTSSEFKDVVKKIVAGPAKLLAIEYPGGNKAVAKFTHEGKQVIIEASLVDKEGQLQESDKQIRNFFESSFTTRFWIAGVAVDMVCSSFSFNYILKDTHKYRKDSKHFLKTMRDLKRFESTFGESIEGMLCYVFDYKEIHALRSKLTYNNNLPKLNQDKREFFTDSVPYVYDHDDIHQAVKHLAKPAYQYYMQDGAEVMCSREKFEALPEFVRLLGVLEESYVLALERAIIPHGTEAKRAFDIALEKVCTSITSGWFREFAYKNYDKVQAMYHEGFVDKFSEALDSGKVKGYNEQSVQEVR